MKNNTLSFECKVYCDNCPLKPAKVTNTVKVYVASIKYIYQQDLFFRAKDYFFDQFLDSLTDTDPYLNIQKSNIEEKLIKFYTEKEVKDYDLKQPEATIELHAEIRKPCIVLKARNHYTEEFSIFLGNITIDSSLSTRTKRWKLCPDKIVKYTIYHFIIENTIFYHKEEQLGSIKTFKVDLENIIHSDLVEFVDPLALNKALFISLNFCPIDCKISKRQFTYLMK